jgi:hypothetical protein
MSGTIVRDFHPHTQQWFADVSVLIESFFLDKSVGAQIGHLTSKLMPFVDMWPLPKMDSKKLMLSETERIATV